MFASDREYWARLSWSLDRPEHRVVRKTDKFGSYLTVVPISTKVPSEVKEHDGSITKIEASGLAGVV